MSTRSCPASFCTQTVATGLLVVGIAILPAHASHGPFTVSAGIYRVPYANGLTVTANNDHHNHPNAVNRVDMAAGQFSVIVAAASGIIRGLVDFNGDDPEEHSCQDDDTVAGDC